MDSTIVLLILYLIGTVLSFFFWRKCGEGLVKDKPAFKVVCAVMALLFPVTIICYLLVLIFEEKE